MDGRKMTGETKKEFLHVTDTVKNWLWSFVQPNNIESEAEYKISKALLQLYIKSQVSIIEQKGVDMMLSFVRSSFETQEEFLCFHYRFGVRHFDSYSNSGHEGTNNGLKYNAAPVLPQHDLHTSGAILTDNAKIKAKGDAVDVSNEVSKTKLWSNLPSANYLTGMSVGLMEHEWKEADMYCCECWAPRKFLVTRKRWATRRERDIFRGLHESGKCLFPQKAYSPAPASISSGWVYLVVTSLLFSRS
jgi:hypothetical protein